MKVFPTEGTNLAKILFNSKYRQSFHTQIITESPDQAHYLFGWDPENDRLKIADFSAVIDKVLINRFEIKIG